MSRSDAYVRVSCDKCGESDEIDLCALAGGGWDERYVDDELERSGWVITKDGDRDICESCVEEEKSAMPSHESSDR